MQCRLSCTVATESLFWLLTWDCAFCTEHGARCRPVYGFLKIHTRRTLCLPSNLYAVFTSWTMIITGHRNGFSMDLTSPSLLFFRGGESLSSLSLHLILPSNLAVETDLKKSRLRPVCRKLPVVQVFTAIVQTDRVGGTLQKKGPDASYRQVCVQVIVPFYTGKGYVTYVPGLDTDYIYPSNGA